MLFQSNESCCKSWQKKLLDDEIDHFCCSVGRCYCSGIDRLHWNFNALILLWLWELSNVDQLQDSAVGVPEAACAIACLDVEPVCKEGETIVRPRCGCPYCRCNIVCTLQAITCASDQVLYKPPCGCERCVTIPTNCKKAPDCKDPPICEPGVKVVRDSDCTCPRCETTPPNACETKPVCKEPWPICPAGVNVVQDDPCSCPHCDINAPIKPINCKQCPLIRCAEGFVSYRPPGRCSCPRCVPEKTPPILPAPSPVEYWDSHLKPDAQRHLLAVVHKCLQSFICSYEMKYSIKFNFSQSIDWRPVCVYSIGWSHPRPFAIYDHFSNIKFLPICRLQYGLH